MDEASERQDRLRLQSPNSEVDQSPDTETTISNLKVDAEEPGENRIMPWDYAKCEIAHIVVMVCHFVEQAVLHNDKLLRVPHPGLTRFHSWSV
jgi:hypothetical protein